MRLTLVSKNPEIQSTVQEIAQHLPSIRVLVSSGSAEFKNTSDVYIWDFEPGFVLPLGVDPTDSRKHLFLVQRKDLGAFRKAIPQAGVGILLKPVAGPILEFFLEHTAKPALPAESVQAERDQILQSLIQANLRLQEYDQDRANFVARAVHDFRAPLTAINGYCSLMLGGQLGALEPEQKEVLVRMAHSAKRLSRMASAMFQLSAGRMIERRPDLMPGDLRQCVEQALHEVLPLTEQKGIEVVFDWIQPPGSMLFEVSQMEQVLINLLENACKFTPKNGAVEIKGYPCSSDGLAGSKNGAAEPGQGHMFRIDIRDSGPGIPEQYLETIFEEYTSYSGGWDRSGGGLGLAICKSIIARHEGRIWAENTPEGTLFSVLLPISENTHPIEMDDPDQPASSALLMET
jgi:signal transduction histidine kinase